MKNKEIRSILKQTDIKIEPAFPLEKHLRPDDMEGVSHREFMAKLKEHREKENGNNKK